MDVEKNQIIIDKSCNLVYASFYIYGLYNIFGSQNIKFGDIERCPKNLDGFRFIIRQRSGNIKIAISLSDNYQINEAQYDWCDLYGSVNANYEKVPKTFHDKLVPLCPSFGIKIWSFPKTSYFAFLNTIKLKTSKVEFVKKYKQQLFRPSYLDYTSCQQTEENSNYVFFLSTLWYSDEWNRNDDGVNTRRANFIHACKELHEVAFEGGLVSLGKGRSSEELFSDCLSHRIPMKEWIEKTKHSSLVFNTPAFWDCHGWKLGEYLALGKCIVSTKLSNDLPAPLEHGKNIHFVENDKDSMKEAIKYIIGHPDYRIKLENGARKYWEQYGSPTASLKLLGITN